MERANKAANFHLEELERNPTLKNYSLAKEAVDWQRETIEIVEVALARMRMIIMFWSCFIASILGVITYQYLKR